MVLPGQNTTSEVNNSNSTEQGDFAAGMAGLLALMGITTDVDTDADLNNSKSPFQNEQDKADILASNTSINSTELLAPTLPLQADPDFLLVAEKNTYPQIDMMDNESFEPLLSDMPDTASTDNDSVSGVALQVQEAVNTVIQERSNRFSLVLDKQRSSVGSKAEKLINEAVAKGNQPISATETGSEESLAKFAVTGNADESMVSSDIPSADKMTALFNNNVDTITAKPSSTMVSMASLPQTVGTPEWQKSLSQQISLFSRDGIQHAQIRLHPDELGAIQISMRMSSERMQIHFMADNIQAREALENALPSLRQSLAESGIELGQSSVGSDTNAASSNASYGEKRASTPNSSLEDSSSDIFDEVEDPTIDASLTRYQSGISTFI